MALSANIESRPQSFDVQVKDALGNLHSLPYLQNHRLVDEIAVSRPVGMTAGQHLREVLLDAIDALNPGKNVPFRSPEGRLFNLLQLHYVETMTVRECAYELGVSERQAYRDLRRAEEGVAALMWAQRQTDTRAEVAALRASDLSSVDREVERFEPHPCAVDLWGVVDRVGQAIGRLAGERGIEIKVTASVQPLTIYADPVLAQQVLTGLLSQVVQQAPPGTVTITVESEGVESGESAISLRLHHPWWENQEAVQLGPVVARLLERLRWTVRVHGEQADESTIVVKMGAHGPTVLVIDDNEGLVSLLRRYLIDNAYRVAPAISARLGLELARSMRPDVIVLDVIMPDMDGWEVLQSLRNDPQTASIPVIICSVFDDPRLAESLGASICLPKPIKRADLLNSLRSLGIE